jgi:LmbE family N-acetylglucosaminyl deacetylase
MDTIPFLDIVQSLEKLIDTIKPSIVFTHHSGDLNIDHRLTHDAVLTACRPTPSSCVREIYSFEVLSSTEWGVFNDNFFIPTKFVDIVDTFDQKMQALHSYNEEMREFPHSRSFESVESLAKLRGSSVGIELAECFQTIRIIEK